MEEYNGGYPGGPLWGEGPSDTEDQLRMEDEQQVDNSPKGNLMREAIDDPARESVPGCTPDPANPKDAIGLKKTPLRLFPPVALVYGAEVMRHGAEKYGEYNWREHPVKLSVYLEAAMRHILQAADGEVRDKESGLPHAAHVMMCMAIILDAQDNACLINDLPDRKTTLSVGRLMEALTNPPTDPI